MIWHTYANSSSNAALNLDEQNEVANQKLKLRWTEWGSRSEIEAFRLSMFNSDLNEEKIKRKYKCETSTTTNFVQRL